MRAKVGDDFWLMYDCWMSLNLDYATRLAIACHDLGLKWIEEALSPDDYWGYADLRRNVPRGMLVTTGRSEEHTSELQSLMRISYAVFCLKKKMTHTNS